MYVSQENPLIYLELVIEVYWDGGENVKQEEKKTGVACVITQMKEKSPK